MDLGRDGDLDLLTTGRYGVQVFSDDGTGTFTRTQITGTRYGSPGAGGYYSVTGSQLTHADLDQDGDQDVVLAAFIEFPFGPAPAFVALFNDGSGQLVSSTMSSFGSSGEGTPTTGLAVADMDEDGHLDVLIGYPASSGVVLYRSTGEGTWSSDQATVPTPAPPGDVEVADIDMDGHLDLVVTSAGSGLANVLYGDGTGSFPESHEVATGGDVVSALAVGRIDGGSLIDLVFGNDSATADPSVAVLLNKEGRPQHAGAT